MLLVAQVFNFNKMARVPIAAKRATLKDGFNSCVKMKKERSDGFCFGYWEFRSQSCSSSMFCGDAPNLVF